MPQGMTDVRRSLVRRLQRRRRRPFWMPRSLRRLQRRRCFPSQKPKASRRLPRSRASSSRRCHLRPCWIPWFARRLQRLRVSSLLTLTPQQAHRLHVFHYWAQQSSPWIRQCTEVSRQLLVTHHLGLVGHVIPSIINTGALEYDDLFQEGVIHLITAVDKFDPMRGFAFSTYALVVIKRGLCALMRSPKVRIAVGMRCTAFFVPFEEQASPMSVDGGISEIEWRLTMRQALAHLDHFDREVAELKYFHGMQKEEIASTLLVDVQSIVAASRRVARELQSRLGVAPAVSRRRACSVDASPPSFVSNPA